MVKSEVQGHLDELDRQAIMDMEVYDSEIDKARKVLAAHKKNLALGYV